MPTDTETLAEIRALGRRWAEAEEAGDTATLDAMAAEDFRLVGPLGFVLDKSQWLDRYRSGAFTTDSLTWNVAEVRRYGDAAVAIGTFTQEASYRGQRADGRFRATQLAVHTGDGWKLAGLHLSPIADRP